MKTYRIATIPGDGIGKEVIPAGRRVLDAIAAGGAFAFAFEDFGWGGDWYRAHGEMMLGQTGLIAMIGKAERGPAAIEAIRKHRSAYLMGVGGAAYLVSKAIKQARVVGFADLGMEAIYEFDVVDMPVTVAVDASGTSVHETGPAEWKARIAKIPVVAA